VLGILDQKGVGDRVDEEISTREMRVSGGEASAIWQRGWDEVCKRILDQKIDFETLKPQYFHEGAPPCRLEGQYIQPASPEFEYWVGLRLRALVMWEYLSQANCIIEFGCGTGINIFLAQLLFPGKNLIGTDWAPASAQILGAMADQTGGEIQGYTFDMLSASGDDGDPWDQDTAVLTVHAMEQLHTGWGSFLEYVLARRPQICVHIEPVLELYGDDDFDNRGRRYHQKRHYLDGYLPELEKLSEAGEIELVQSRRVRFGGQYHEAYSIIVWKPL
jgi:SAM-dependent methyltransferase